VTLGKEQVAVLILPILTGKFKEKVKLDFSVIFQLVNRDLKDLLPTSLNTLRWVISTAYEPTPMPLSQRSSSPSAKSHSENGYEPLELENGWRIGGPDWRKPWPSGLMFLTWFGAGFSYHAPGTIGSLNALPMAAGIVWFGGTKALALAAIIPFVLGLIYTARYLRHEPDSGDPQWIVIDEVVGLWIALSVVPLNLIWYVLGFGLFRFFDIFKPWPVSWADQSVPGALGIMLDDVLAGLYAAGVLIALQHVWATYF